MMWSKSKLFDQLRFDLMPVNGSWTMPAEQAVWFGHAYVRTKISTLNGFLDINIKVHSNGDGSLSFWHSTDPRTKTLSMLERVEQAKDKLRQAAQTHEGIEEASRELRIIEQQTLKKAKAFTRKKRGKSISQPMQAVLNFYGLTKNEFILKQPSEQLRLWVQAEVAIRKQQDEEGNK